MKVKGIAYNGAMILAGDVGGTKTRLGLFRPAPRRPEAVAVDEFITLDYDGLEAIIEQFLARQGVTSRELSAACVGVAGAVTDQVATLTNVPWRISASAMTSALTLEQVSVLNDLEALAYAVSVLDAGEIAVLQEGVRVASGNMAVIAAGTGLGESMLLNVDGRFVPGESEGGHADFAARTPRELDMVSALTPVLGRISAESILSGPGLVNIYQFTHQAIGSAPFVTTSSTAPSRLCAGVGEVSEPADLPAAITSAAADGRCDDCVETLDLFVSAYGAEAGNLALRTVATAGVYIGGGIAPHVLPALRAGGFMDAFRAKAPMDDLVSRIPVAVILNSRAGLLGAAVHAAGMLASR
ncbi:MAG: glucokinase [Vicinamibacterales bacterium]